MVNSRFNAGANQKSETKTVDYEVLPKFSKFLAFRHSRWFLFMGSQGKRRTGQFFGKSRGWIMNKLAKKITTPIVTSGEAIKEDQDASSSSPPSHRVTPMNISSTEPYQSLKSLKSKAAEFGSTFKLGCPRITTEALYVGQKRNATSCAVEENERNHIWKLVEAERIKGNGWIQLFSIFRLKNGRPFIWPIELTIEELMKTALVATRLYIEKEKQGVENMDLLETIIQRSKCRSTIRK